METCIDQQKKRYFFDDRARVADYVRRYCAPELEHVLRVADETVRREFLFDLRWDMERTCEMVRFEDEINWLYQPGDDHEWTFQLNRMRFWICLGQAYAVTGDEAYAGAFARQLRHWIASVKRQDPACANAWRSIEAGIRLENWLKAMCYFQGSPSIAEETVQAFTASIIDHAEYLMGVWDDFNLVSNWGVLAGHGLFLAGIMLPEAPRAALYVETALERLEKDIRMQVYPDGMHWEQSPMYHNEVLRCYLDVVLLAKRRGVAMPEAILDGTRRMLLADLWMGKPDGHELCMGDSDDIDQRDLLMMGAVIFQDGTLKHAAGERLDYDSVWELGTDAAEEYAALPAKKPDRRDAALTESGNFIFRSGWASEDTYLHFHCGTIGGGHGHADQLHVDLFSRGEDILLDPGRFTYVDKPDRYVFKECAAHNTSTVDGKDFTVCDGSWAFSKLCRAVNTRFSSCERYGYAEGGHTGYCDAGVWTNRRLLYIRPDIVVITDEFYSGASHRYTQRFHWNEEGRVTGRDDRYRYESLRNTVELTLLSAAPLDTRVVPSRVSRRYNESAPGPALLAEAKADGSACLFAVLSLNPAGEAETFSAERLDVRFCRDGSLLDSRLIEALRVRKGEREYIVVIGHQEYAATTGLFAAGGCTGMGGAVVFERSAGETEGGTVLAY